jgi:pimeloyl-ACP methyl ester carboxylesterase
MAIISLITEHIASTDSIELSVYKYGRANDFEDKSQASASQQRLKPAVMLSHATGFHGRCFDPVVESLQTDYACTSFDYRGYGDSLLDKDWAVDWQGYCDDALTVARSLKNNERSENAIRQAIRDGLQKRSNTQWPCIRSLNVTLQYTSCP